uniref:Uncharacterized protein n=1 Tax=Ditylenchus dipsaci TaxID=166011 RepID=A0A915D109_9BILA
MLLYVYLGDGGFGCTDLIIRTFTDKGANTQAKIAFNRRLSRARSATHMYKHTAKCEEQDISRSPPNNRPAADLIANRPSESIDIITID